jgi:hypothetical protein
MPKYADQGWTVLVTAHVPGGLDERASYVVGCDTDREAMSKVQEMYGEDRITMVCGRLTANAVSVLKLEPDEVRPWH